MGGFTALLVAALVLHPAAAWAQLAPTRAPDGPAPSATAPQSSATTSYPHRNAHGDADGVVVTVTPDRPTDIKNLSSDLIAKFWLWAARAQLWVRECVGPELVDRFNQAEGSRRTRLGFKLLFRFVTACPLQLVQDVFDRLMHAAPPEPHYVRQRPPIAPTPATYPLPESAGPQAAYDPSLKAQGAPTGRGTSVPGTAAPDTGYPSPTADLPTAGATSPPPETTADPSTAYLIQAVPPAPPPHASRALASCSAVPPAVCEGPLPDTVQWSSGPAFLERPVFYRFQLSGLARPQLQKRPGGGFSVELPGVHAVPALPAGPIADAHYGIRSATAFNNNRAENCSTAAPCFQLSIELADPSTPLQVFHTGNALWLAVGEH